MKMRSAFVCSVLFFSLQTILVLGEKPSPTAAANVDWEKVRATPAALTVLNMEAVPLKVSKDKDGWLKAPERLLKSEFLAFKSVGDTNGVADFKVTSDGFVLVACNFDYQGNSSGEWRTESLTLKQFREQGWIEASSTELGGDLVNHRNRVQHIFAKFMKAGDTGRLRCNKYDPPIFMVAASAK